ncbi:MAG: BatA domain-containing protein [Kiritimatiellia bacterium]
MTFGNPIFLWGLLVVPLPILMHLFFKRRKAKIPFSTLQYFQQNKRYLAHRRRLRELLLLLVRTLALLFLVLALARMMFQRMPYAFAARSDVVVVLDDTLSMDRKLASGESAYELGVRKAREILNTLSDGDAVALVFISGRRGIDLTRRRPVVQQLLEESHVTAAAGSFSAAFKQAAAVFEKGANPNREIFVISDFQRNQASSKAVDMDDVQGLRLYFLPVSGSEDNVAVESITLTSRPRMVGKPMTIPYAIRNYGRKDCETEVALLIDGEKINSVNLKVLSGDIAEGQFEMVPVKAGYISGEVRINDRNLPMDNSRRFALNVSENIRVLLLESDVLSRVRPYYFLKVALDPDHGGAVNGILTEPGFVQELSLKQLEEYHVVVLSNPLPLDTEAASVLTRYMQGGGTVMIFAGVKTGTKTLAAFSDERISKIFGPRADNDFSGLTFKGSLAALNDLLQMDLFRGQRFYTFNLSPSAEVLAESRGQPVLAVEKAGDGNFIVCAFSSRRDMSNWPELKSYPIAMINLFTFAAHDPQRNSGVECGRLLRLRAMNQDDKDLQVGHSNGKSFSLPVEGDEAVFSETWRPGFVTAERASPRMTALNPAPKESELASLGHLRLTSIVKGKVNLLKTGAALEPQLRNTRRGSDLTGFLLFLLMILLICEIILGNSYLLRHWQRKRENS